MAAVITGLAVFVCAAAAFVGYRISLSWFPYTRCSKCEGSGRRGGSNRARWGPCKRCGGSGKRERLGRRVFGLNKDR